MSEQSQGLLLKSLWVSERTFIGESASDCPEQKFVRLDQDDTTLLHSLLLDPNFDPE